MEEVEDVGDLRRERLLGRKHLRAPGEVLEIARGIALSEHADAILVVGILLEDEVEASAHHPSQLVGDSTFLNNLSIHSANHRQRAEGIRRATFFLSPTI